MKAPDGLNIELKDQCLSIKIEIEVEYNGCHLIKRLESSTQVTMTVLKPEIFTELVKQPQRTISLAILTENPENCEKIEIKKMDVAIRELLQTTARYYDDYHRHLQKIWNSEACTEIKKMMDAKYNAMVIYTIEYFKL